MFALVTGFFMLRAGGGLHWFPPFRHEYGTIDTFGRELFTRGLVPFELTTALFVVAVVGALAVARGRHRSDAPSEGAKEQAP
jgi:NADH-quinone oxidoreductase subunit J